MLKKQILQILIDLNLIKVEKLLIDLDQIKIEDRMTFEDRKG